MHRVEKIQFITVPGGLEAGAVEKPMYSSAPVAFLWLSAYLESRGAECSILDAYTLGMDLEAILDEVESYQPDMVGFSIFTVALFDSLFLAREIKKRHPELIVVFGGYHVNHSVHEILETGVVDYCVRGEGEDTLTELVDCVNRGGGSSTGLAGIKGLAWLKDGQVLESAPRENRASLDGVPAFPYEKVAGVKYVPWGFSHGSSDRFLSTVTSKGCPMDCDFCDIAVTEGTRFRPFPAERIVDEVKRLYGEFGVNQIGFMDALFTVRRDRVSEMCKLLSREELPVEWSCSSSIQCADNEEMLGLMAAAGCKTIFYGVESGNPQTLKAVKKLTLDRVRRVIGLTKNLGISAHTSFILGLPGDTKESIRETIEFAKDLKPNTVSFSIATPYLGTALYDTYKDLIFTSDYRMYGPRAVFRVPEYDPEWLEEMVVRAHREFYLRPGYIASQLTKVRTWHDLGARVRLATDFLGGRLGYKVRWERSSSAGSGA